VTGAAEDEWADAVRAVESARSVWSVQLADRWLLDPAIAPVRDALDLALFRRVLRHPRRVEVRRLLHYDPPSDLGGEAGYGRVKIEHENWLGRVRRQLAYVGAAGSIDGAEPPDCDYLIRLVIVPRVGRPSNVDPPDGIWIDTEPPELVRRAWDTEGLIALDPHGEPIIGPYSDRNPLWVGNMT
jgi:hypothetical protein